jgi:hypothetical protein
MEMMMVIIAGLSVWAVAASVVGVVKDGYGRIPTRQSR